MDEQKTHIQKRSISMEVLYGLTWLNLVLIGILAIEQRTQPLIQAYLLGRTPADAVVLHEAGPELAFEQAPIVIELPVQEALIENTSSTSPTLVIQESSSSIASISSIASSLSSDELQSSAVSVEAQSIESTTASISSIPSPSSPSSASSVYSVSSESSIIPSSSGFPEMGNAVMPITEVPNWGAMKTPAEWNRSYREMNDDDFVKIPPYTMSTLTIPVKSLESTRDDPKTIEILTDKLFYSTRYFGAYDIDAEEFSAVHPGIDLKLAEGTPVGTVAGGRVHDVRYDPDTLGKHVIIEHRAADGHTFYSIYGHLASVSVKVGDSVTSGQMIGTVGMTGNTSGPHLHLQIDRGEAGEASHTVYWPGSVPSRSEADRFVINPITFVHQY